jgi:aldose 1-epimerase
MNIAAHPYWCLDGGVDVSRHRLQIDATEYTPTDPQNIPTGQIAATAGSLFDFARAKYVPLDPALDVNFCLARAERRKPVHAATLTGADGTRLDIATTAPGLQVYNGAYLPSNAAILSDAADLNPFKAIALEPQYWPDAPNIAHFPQITLNPGSTWRQTTTYALSQGPVK